MLSSSSTAPADEGLWIFGYGSLVWRPEFPHRERRPGWVSGWKRRFWQGSTDHRGTPAAPGRVATLVPESEAAGSRCWGMAYRIDPAAAGDVFEALDRRERGGYDRVDVTLKLDGAARSASGIMYLATPENPNYLGPASLDQIARQIVSSHGPSGANIEYVLRLAAALREVCPDLSAANEETLALAALLDAIRPAEGPSAS